MTLKLFAKAIAILAIPACATPASTLDPSTLSAVFIADFSSTEPQVCTTANVDLTNDEALAFFRRAKPLSARRLADNYPVAPPCKVEGTLKRSIGPCDFEISAAMTGVIQCGAERWHFACEDCSDLFSP